MSFRVLAALVSIVGLSIFSLDIRMRSVLKEVSTFDAISSSTTNSNEESKQMLTRSGAKCLTFDKTLDDLIASSKNVFITMPAKAAGSSMKTFTEQCAGPYGPDNMLNIPSTFEKAFTAKGAEPLPSIIASHLIIPTAFINLVKNIPRQSLVLYVYRDETDRLMSAIKQVIITRICTYKLLTLDSTQINGSRCIINEKEVIEKVIKLKIKETRRGTSEIMTCGFYDAIQENFPQLVFVHYKQANRIQKVLAKHHCPDLLDNPIHKNVGQEKEMEAFLKLGSNGKEIALDDWLKLKRDMLEFTFQLNAKQTCKAKTLSLQDDLFGCEDEILQITRDTSF